jgi:hypothetical protein
LTDEALASFKGQADFGDRLGATPDDAEMNARSFGAYAVGAAEPVVSSLAAGQLARIPLGKWGKDLLRLMSRGR